MKNIPSTLETYGEGYRNTVAPSITDIMIGINHVGVPYPVLPSIYEAYLQGICGQTFTHKGVRIVIFRDGGVKIQVSPSGDSIPMAPDRPYRSNPNYSVRTFRLKNYNRLQTGVAYSIEEFCDMAAGNLTI